MFNSLRKTAKNNWILLIILFSSLLIRFIGLIPGYSMNHPDEGIFYSSAIKMLINGDYDPGRYDYPSGVSLIHYFIYSQFILPIVVFRLLLSHPQAIIELTLAKGQFFNDFWVPIFGNREMYALFWSRHITALMGAASVFVTYLAGSRLFNKKTGLFAAFFLTFNYRHVYSSHFSLSDAPNSLFAILTFLICIFLFKKNSLKNYILAGLFLGVSFSIKYQVFPVITFLLVHLYWVLKKKNLWAIFDRKVFLALFLMVLLFSVANIHIFFNSKEALSWIQLVSSRYGAGSNRFNFYPLYYLYYWGIGILPFITIILGIILGLIIFPFRSLMVLSFILPFFFVFLYYLSGGTYVRNFTTVMPFLMIFAGLFFSLISDLLGKIFKKRSALSLGIILVLLLVVNFESMKNSLSLSTNFLGSWPRPLLQEWADKKMPNNAKVANDNLGIDYKDKNYIRPWNVNGENSIAELQEKNFDFAVSNIEWRQSLLQWWFDTPFSELMQYTGIPYKLLENSYTGIAMEEFLEYEVFETYKSWQSPNLNYFISKIPSPINPEKEIASFDFENGNQRWFSVNLYGIKNIKGLTWDEKSGNVGKGSLIFEGTDPFKGQRFTSGFISIKPGKVYTAVGYIKTEDNLTELRERDAFLRLDFYEKNDLGKLGEGGVKKTVSGRIFGTIDWVRKQTTGKSLPTTKFMTVSFQKDFYAGKAWLDDVKIYESDEIPEKFPQIPVIKSTIPKDVLYPNSIL